MMCKILITLSVLFLLSISALAFDEPRDFRGLKFGQDLTQQLPKCHDTETAYDIRRCWEPQKSLAEMGVIETDDDTPRYLIKNEPPIGKFPISKVIASQIDGKMESLSVYFSGWFTEKYSDTQEMVEILSSRYGDPIKNVENASEALRRETQWEGKSINLAFSQIIISPISSWTIDFQTTKHSAFHAARRKAKAQKAAGDL